MAFEEYPKALYRAGDYKAVHDEDDEHASRAEGWDDWAADHARTTGEADAAADETDAPTPAKRTTKKAG